MNRHVCIVTLLSCIFVFPLFFFKYSSLSLPLINFDEMYYVNLGIFESFSAWTHISYGHPPGWNFLNGVVFSIFGNSPTVVHSVGLTCSILSIITLLFTLSRIWTIPVSFLCVTLIFSNRYFLKFCALNHPVIAASTCGFLSLLFLREKKYIFFTIFITCSLLIRESSLVFIVAGIFMKKNTKVIKHCLIPLGVFFLFYLQYFLVHDKIMINNAIRHTLEQSDPEYNSVFIFEISHALKFFSSIFYPSNNPFLYIIIIMIIPVFFLKKNFVSLKREPLFISFLTVFILHSLIFSFYALWPQSKNTFFSSTALILLVGILLSSIKQPKRISSLILFSLSIIIWIQSLAELKSQIKSTETFKRLTPLVKDLGLDLSTLRKNYEGLRILSYDRIASWMNHPDIGFIKENQNVLDINRLSTGPKTDKEINYLVDFYKSHPPDIIIITYGFGKFGFVGNKGSKKALEKLLNSSHYTNVKTYSSSHKETIKMYLSKKNQLYIQTGTLPKNLKPHLQSEEAK